MKNEASPTATHQKVAVESTAITWILAAIAALLPIAIFPIGDNFIIQVKPLVLLGSTLIVWALWLTNAFRKRVLQVTLSPMLPALVVLAIVTILTTLASSNPPGLLYNMLGAGGIYLSLALLPIFAGTLISQEHAQKGFWAVTIGGLLISLTTIAEQVGFGPSRVLNLILGSQFPSSTVFSLTGAPLFALEVLMTLLVLLFATMWQNRPKVNPLHAISTAVITVGTILNGIAVVQQSRLGTVILPFEAGWTVALEAMKSLRILVFGVGPENFASAYMQLKPASFNLTPYWNLTFGQSSNLPLTFLTTMGLLGLAAWLFLVIQTLRFFRQSSPVSKPIGLALLATFAIQAVLPPQVLIFALQAVLMSFWVAKEKKHLKDVQLHAFTVQIIKSGDHTQKVPQQSDMMVYGVIGISSIILALSTFWWVRYSVAQMIVFQGNFAALRKNVSRAFRMQHWANVVYPYSDDMHRAYGLSNLSIALAISNSKDATDKEKAQIVPLVQQAIRQERFAQARNPMNSANWIALAQVYSNLMQSSKDAEGWATAAYGQAQAVAPKDAALSLEIGGFLYRAGKYNEASRMLEQTVALKSDWPSAYYNLAGAYRKDQQYEKALAAYQQTLRMVQDNADQVKLIEEDIRKTQEEAKNPPKKAAKGAQVAPTATPAATPSPSPATQLNASTPAPTPFPSDVQQQLQSAELEKP